MDGRVLCRYCRRRLTIEVAPDDKRRGRAACECGYRGRWFLFSSLRPGTRWARRRFAR